MPESQQDTTRDEHDSENSAQTGQDELLPTSARLAQHSIIATATQMRCTECQPELIIKMLSLPLMETIVDVVRSQPLDASTDSIQVELLARLAEEIGKEASPWSRLRKRNFTDGLTRTDEHYRCVLDVALAARLGLRNTRKMSKFWKKTALLADPSVITPSPSDISDTGVSPELSPYRQEMLEQLLLKRASTEAEVDEQQLSETITESNPLQLTSIEGSIGNGTSASRPPSPIEGSGRYEAADTTLVDTGSHLAFSAIQDSPNKSQPKRNISKIKFPGKAVQGPTPSTGPRSFIPRRPSMTPASASSDRSQTSVQTKRMIFENMGSAIAENKRAKAHIGNRAKIPKTLSTEVPTSQTASKISDSKRTTSQFKGFKY